MEPASTPYTGDNSAVGLIAPQLTVSIYLGSELQVIPQSAFLSHVWGDGLNSNCMTCGKPFLSTIEPPIRTIAFELAKTSVAVSLDITSAPVAPYYIRIFNRHFACIKAQKINYIPVSHAWHEDVAIASSGRTADVNAARIVYQNPVRSLLAIRNKYGKSEIWHDYLSVPHWRREVQQQIILIIPDIFNFPETTVIHLDDVKAAHLSNNPESSIYNQFISDLSAIIRSRWFDRMWVTLEYIQSKEIRILTEDYIVCDISARELSLGIYRAALKWTKKRGNSKFTLDIRNNGSNWSTMVSWNDMETWKCRHDKYRTLGFAIAIMGCKKCLEQKDYYLALGGMLDFKPKQNSLIVVQDTFQYFLSLALHALESGDYTPLLFTPLAAERTDPRAPWLRGYSQMSEIIWDLGVCHSKAKLPEIIRNGKIQPKLETVGIIEWFEYYNFQGHEDSVFDYIASRIVKASGSSPTALCSAVDRIFTYDEKKALHTEWKDRQGEDSIAPIQKYDFDFLRPLLNEYTILLYQPCNEETARRRLELSRQIIVALNLNQKGKHAKETRMEATFGEAHWYLQEHGRYMEGIGQIRCKFCGQRSIFRMTLWEAPVPDAAQVYRIPGLLYDETVPEGVGLVVYGQQIIGKMIYGTPACECHILELVEVG